MDIIEQYKLTNFNEIIYQELIKSDFVDKSIEDEKLKFSANTLFQIEAISNLNEPSKTKYQNSKSGMLQLMLYPGKMIGVEMEKMNIFDKDLLQYAGQKLLVKQTCEMYKGVLLLKQKDVLLIDDYKQLLKI